MEKEKLFFLQMLHEHICKEDTQKTDGLNWDMVVGFAKAHQMEAILYYQCRKWIGTCEELQPYREGLGGGFGAALHFSVNRNNMCKAVEKGLSQAQIPVFCVKGLEVAECYPMPALRTMGDLDFVVSSDDRARADVILREMGFVNHTHGALEWRYTRSGLEIELHDRLIYDAQVSIPETIDFFNKCRDHLYMNGENHYTLEPTWQFLFLIIHLRKHILDTGIGFRHFLDLLLFARKHGETIDWHFVDEKVKDFRLEAFYERVNRLCIRWYGFGWKEINGADLSEEEFESVTDSVFRNGVFGFENADNTVNALTNSMDDHVTEKGKLKYLVHSVLPPYSYMCHSPGCEFVNGRPFLLPIAWLKRGIRIMREKGSGKTVYASSDTIRRRKEYFSIWGL